MRDRQRISSLRLSGWAVLAAGLLIPAGVARAQEIPEGLPAGPWVLTPRLSSEFTKESNLFRTSDAGTSDTTTRFSAGLGARLPFRNSLLSLDYEAGRRRYKETTFARKEVQDLTVELNLRFSRGDQLSLRDRFRRDFERLGELDVLGSEVVFRGEPYNVNQWEVELSRDIPQKQGYSMNVRRVDFNIKGDADSVERLGLNFFDYRGFDSAFEYRQPLPAERWWLVRYGSRRFNNYCPALPEELGVPFRQERSDSLQVGLRGRISGAQSFFARLGLVRFQLDGLSARESCGAPIDSGSLAQDVQYEGLSGAADWKLELGRRTHAQLSLERVPLPSGFTTYYISDEFQALLERQFLRHARLGVSARLGQNRYGSNGGDAGCEDERLREYRALVTTELLWFLHERAALRLSGTHELRGSNCESRGYDASTVRAGILLGWF